MQGADLEGKSREPDGVQKKVPDSSKGQRTGDTIKERAEAGSQRKLAQSEARKKQGQARVGKARLRQTGKFNSEMRKKCLFSSQQA